MVRMEGRIRTGLISVKLMRIFKKCIITEPSDTSAHFEMLSPIFMNEYRTMKKEWTFTENLIFRFDVDLDKPASERFVEVAKAYKDNIHELIQVIKGTFSIFPFVIQELLEIVFPSRLQLCETYPDDYSSTRSKE